jgi:hypothetical protein
VKTALALVIVVLAVVAGGAQTAPQTPPRDQSRPASVGSAVISGTVVADDETRAPLQSATVTLERAGGEDIRSTSTDEQGRFAFDRLPAAVVVRLGSPSTAPLLGGPTPVMVNADRTFKIDGVMPGSSSLAVTLPVQAGAKSQWFVRSAMSGGRDLMDVPLDVRPGSDVSNIVVTLSDVPTEVSGTLVDAAGRPAPEFYVFMFPTDKTTWGTISRRIKFTRANDTGSYVIAGLPPGDYYLCALTEVDVELRFESSYLEQLIPSSIKITLAEGEKKKQDLRIGG